jgi:hypothetical protein
VRDQTVECGQHGGEQLAGAGVVTAVVAVHSEGVDLIDVEDRARMDAGKVAEGAADAARGELVGRDLVEGNRLAEGSCNRAGDKGLAEPGEP